MTVSESASEQQAGNNFHRERSIDDLFLDNLPRELSRFLQWVVYKLGPIKPSGKRDKILLNPHTGRFAAVDDSTSWGTRGEAVNAYLGGMGDGLGFVFTATDPYVGTDLDGCRNPDTGQLEPWALDIVQRQDSYTEASPSGTGVHILSKGKLPGGGGKKDHVEMYDHGRFFTMTGEHIGGTPTCCEDRQEPITALYREHFSHKMNGHGAHTEGHTHSQMSEEERQRILADLRLALSHIPAIEHDMWLQVGMGLHHVDSSDVGFDLWVEWSKTCPEKFDFADCEKRWRSFHDDGGITHASIFAWAIEHGWKGTGPHTEDAGERPRIVVNNRQLRDVIDEALTMLVNANDPPTLFQRANALVHVLRDEYGRPAITTMSEAGVVERLTRGADFFTEHAPPKGASEKKIVSVDPPKGLVNVLHGSPQWPFPALVGLCECPVLRPDGSVVDRPGYDLATRLLYQPTPGLTLPAIPATPTRAQAHAARQFLCDELFADFPFCADADKANMLATLLTPILRPAIQGHVPLCLIDKPSAGSGATLLADVVGTVSTGTHAGKATMPTGRGGEEEMRKKIFSVLLTAREVVVLDNIDHALASSELASVLTAGFKEDRPLGSSRNIRVPARVFWIATANNIALRGDLARRSYRVRIDPKQDRPWTRDTFRHADLLAWIRAHRGELLAALLTMARGWFANGKPAAATKPPKIGSFEEWVDTLAGILSFAGMPEFLTNLEELYDMVDEDAAQWRVFIETWHRLLGDRSLTVADLARTLQEVPDLLDALPESLAWDTEKLTSSKHKLGFALKKRRDKHFGGYRLEQDTKDPHTQKAQWKVRYVQL